MTKAGRVLDPPTMPSLEVDSHGVAAVADFVGLLQDLLRRSEAVKQTTTIEPALRKTDFDDLPGQVSRLFADLQPKPSADIDSGRKRQRQYAVIETAVREVFSVLVVSRSRSLLPLPKSWSDRDLCTGENVDRLARLCQGLESPRHPIHPLGQLAVRSDASLLAGGRAPRQPDHRRLPEGV